MRTQFILIFSMIAIYVQSQEVTNYNYDAFSLIGYKDGKPVFICNPLSRYKYSINEKAGSLYYAKESNGFLSFVLYKEIDREAIGDALFIQDECVGYDSYYGGKTLTIYSNNKKNKFEFKGEVFYGSYTMTPSKELIVSPNDGESAQLEFIFIDDLSQERIKLPLIGNFTIIINNWLYFSTYHINGEYTHYPLDVYRVKMGDWNNPELLLEEAVESWMPVPNTNIIYTQISIDGNLQSVYYDTKNKTYEITEDRFRPELIKFEGKYMINNTCKDEQNGNTKYCLRGLPVFDHPFATKDNRTIRENMISVNLSNAQKPFTGTFISDELLYHATETELGKLGKDKLRLLRNAFFARQGYKFKSRDLQEFFGQFEWYGQLLKSYKELEIGNAEVVISPKDKERVALIKKIEEGK